MASIVVLAGSPSLVSRTAALADYVGDRLSDGGHCVTVVRLRELPADELLAANTSDPAVAEAVRLVLDADALVVATPIYKASYSGLLKAFLDLLPQSALLGKAVLPLATGGTVAHVLAIDYSLRPVLMSLAAGHITSGRFVLDKHIDHRSGGPLLTDEATQGSVDRTLDAFRAAIAECERAAETVASAPVRESNGTLVLQ